MVEINIKEILDYAKCPMLYYLKYVKKEKTNFVSIIEEYDKEIHNLIYSAYRKKRLGEKVRLSDLKTSWGKLWIKDTRKTSIAYSETLSNKNYYSDKRKAGIDTLMYLNTIISNENKIIKFVNFEYKINITDKLVIKGEFEIVKSDKDSVEVCIYDTKEYSLGEIDLNFNLRNIASEIAATSIFKDNKVKMKIYILDKKKAYEKVITSTNTFFFKDTIEKIYKCIYNKIFFVIPSERCINCIYKELCNDDIFLKGLKGKK